jgi:hypothetical protein
MFSMALPGLGASIDQQKDAAKLQEESIQPIKNIDK